jgi:hypothetical protein
MIDDLELLKQSMEKMDAEDPEVAQAAKDRAAHTLGDAKLSFAKMAELIEQRRLLLRPRIVASIKRMDHPGALGDAAFRDTGSALRKEGQSFRQIAEAIERTGRLTPGSTDPVQTGEPLHQMPGEPGEPAWRRALVFVARLVLFPLRHPIRFLAIALLATLLFYALRGLVAPGQQVLRHFDGVAVRDNARKTMSPVTSFVDQHILGQSSEATTPPPIPAPIPSPPVASPPSATASAAAATTSAPAAPAPAASADVSAAPAAPAAPMPAWVAPMLPPVVVPGRAAKGKASAKSAAGCCAAWQDRDPGSRRCAPVEDERPRDFKDIIPEGVARNSRMAGRCFGGVGGCNWGGGRY